MMRGDKAAARSDDRGLARHLPPKPRMGTRAPDEHESFRDTLASDRFVLDEASSVPRDQTQLCIHVLGPLAVHLGTRLVTPSAAKQRQVLALLALNAGRLVTVTTLMEELWGDYPPRSSATTLQTYIFQLRRKLADHVPRERVATELLRTSHSGYLLECRTDVDDFHRLSRAGSRAAEAGDQQVVSEILGKALALWRGAAFTDVRQGPVLETERESLEETRLGVIQRRLEADLALNRHADILGELTRLVAMHPMNENFWGFLMMAHYRSGRVARALDTFQRLRAILGRELGVDPCPRLQQLHQAILSGDPDLDCDEFSVGGQSRSGRS